MKNGDAIMYINEETISVNVPHTIQSSRNENVVTGLFLIFIHSVVFHCI